LASAAHINVRASSVNIFSARLQRFLADIAFFSGA
jgi:hypothetical protein